MKTGRCLYCKTLTQLTAEHIMPANMGGNLKAHLVCDPCRQRTHKMDQSLAVHSWVSIPRAALTPPGRKATMGASAFFKDEESGLHVEISLGTGLRPSVLPQIHATLGQGSGTFWVKAEDDAGLERLKTFLECKAKTGTLSKLYVKHGPIEHCDRPRLVMHREDDGFVRVPRRGDEVLFLRVLTEQLAQVLALITGQKRTETTTEQPHFSAMLSLQMDDVCRAAAKIAFGTFAHHLGEDSYCRPEFDPIRRYIRDGDWEGKQEADERGEIILSPFVNFDSPPALVQPSSDLLHTVAVVFSPHGVLGEVTLYRSARFLVTLARSAPVVHPSMLIIHDFSHDATSNTFLKDVKALSRFV